MCFLSKESTAKYKMFGFLCATIFNIPIGYILTFNFGILGSAISTMLSCVFAAFILFVFVNRKVREELPPERKFCFYFRGEFDGFTHVIYK
ncbi:polysaccharide biosynthesis C-terminal domain-containing protein [Vibrio cyclitrophicus]|uniref:polysaccharide biosynthesis C-terminal domain-containing protein n=1 Tax=Vibrio cyclitrophicus TaxID=47951 RepID=UPI0038B67F1B